MSKKYEFFEEEIKVIEEALDDLSMKYSEKLSDYERKLKEIGEMTEGEKEYYKKLKTYISGKKTWICRVQVKLGIFVKD